MGWMVLPVRLEIPFAAASDRRGGVRLALEPCGRIILARAAARGASPMRPAHAKPNVVARVARRLA
jgi:hypothetical protein